MLFLLKERGDNSSRPSLQSIRLQSNIMTEGGGFKSSVQFRGYELTGQVSNRCIFSLFTAIADEYCRLNVNIGLNDFELKLNLINLHP